MRFIKFSIILPAYKEREINKVLKLLLKQSLPKKWKLDKIFVVACGYENFSFLKDEKIQIIKESLRRGKAHAINLALKKINSKRKLNYRPDVIIVQSADVFPKKSMLKNLLEPFDDARVGMTCVRPISLDSPKNFIGFLNNLIWSLHHFISLESPKVGEAFAFRNIVQKIPKKIATDEAYTESVIKKRGYKVVYMPNAVVFNRGAQNVSDFINQRRRIFTGHIHIKNQYGYRVSTMSIKKVLRATLKYCKIKSVRDIKQIFWLFSAALLEFYARTLGTIDFYVFSKVPYVWKIIKTPGR